MEFISGFVITLGEQQIALHRYLIILVLFLHVPFAGMLLGGALLSVLINLFHLPHPSENFSRFAREILDHTVSTKIPVLVLGILPLFSLVLLNVQWFAGVDVPLLGYLSLAVVLIILGFVLLIAYRRGLNDQQAVSMRHIMPGAMGAGLLLAGYFFLLGSLTLFNHTGKWPLLDGPLDVILTWNSIWRFAEFVVLSFVIAGIGALFFLFKWPGKNTDPNTSYGRLAKYFSAGTALAAALLVPLIAFFFHVTSPVAAMSLEVYAVWIIVLLLLMMVCLFLLSILTSGNTRYGTHVFLILLVAVLGLIASDQLAMENATREHTLYLQEKAEALTAEREETRQLQMAKQELPAGAGRELYEAKCTACHLFDKRLVGPPHREVVPQYKDNIDGLVAFLRNPEKKNPDYPPMPSLGLSTREARAIAEYLVDEVMKEE